MMPTGHSLKKAVKDALANDYLQQALKTYPVQRTEQVSRAVRQLPDAAQFRRLARQIKDDSLEHLDELLGELADNLEALGAKVHWAADDDQARRIILEIAREHSTRRCIKSKSMVSQEIALADALIAAGVETVETDLGEFIVQLDEDRPSHIITPMLHKSRRQVARLFQEKLGAPYTEQVEDLTRIAREYLREKFQQADLGIVGVNFAVAQTGSLVVLTNEGNGRFCTAVPSVQIALMGMEKVIRSPADLAVMLKLLVRSAVGTPLTVYTNIITGPRRTGELDGPEHLHVVILDNGRSKILGGPYRQLLCCLRCGACLNACPVYRTIGGHAYGSVYPGPIGAALTPLLKSYQPKIPRWPRPRVLGEVSKRKNLRLEPLRATPPTLRMFEPSTLPLPELSSLCGACLERCPVMIDIPRILIHLRRDIQQMRKSSVVFRRGLALWGWFYRTPGRYRFWQRWLRRLMRPMARRGWITWAPPPMSAWVKQRDLPLPAKRLFRDIWLQKDGQP